MPVESHARAHFASLLERDPVPLDEAALAIAEEEYPQLDVEEYLVRLDALGTRVRARASESARPASVLSALRRVLHDEDGLRGNEAEYHDPRNSFLNDVLDRKLGIPITLSIVWLEVARRVGLRLDGVGFPGHFLVRYASAGGAEVFVDPFHGGEMLSAEECVARYRARTGGRDLDRRYLAPVGTRQILARMLQNLKKVYADRHDDVRTYAVVDRILLLAPAQLDALRDRGLAAARLGGRDAAARDLEAYLARAPSAPDAAEVRRVLGALRGKPPLAN